jgi:quercetin dioxygenase-like cupin family protein
VAGQGILRVGTEEHLLTAGVVIPVEANAVHNVQGDPGVAILVTFFRQVET